MPAITLRCPGCRKRLTAPEKAAGRTLRCPNCGGPVTVAADLDATVVDGTAPDFSYLRSHSDSDDDILKADDPDDSESALGQSTARRPSQPTRVVPVPPPTAPVVYTPPAAGVNGEGSDNPFVELGSGEAVVASPRPPSDVRKKSAPIGKSEAEPDPTPSPPTPGWVWPTLIGLTVYAAVATAAAVWGWLVPR